MFGNNGKSATRMNSRSDYTFGNRVVKPRDYSEWDKLAKKWDQILDEDNQTTDQIEKCETMHSSTMKTHELTKLDYDELKLRIINIPIHTRQKLAEREKEKGNESFKSGDYADALRYYKRSLIMHKTNAVYNNRALIYLRQKQWNQAVNDCTKVLKTEPDNLKALFRRSQANFELDNLEQAEKDLTKLTDQDPTNVQAQELLRNVKAAILKRKKPHLENSRRMIITDVGDSSDDDDDDDSDDTDEENVHQQKMRSEESEIHQISNDNIECHENNTDSDKFHVNIDISKNDNVQLIDKSTTFDISKQENGVNIPVNNNEQFITTCSDEDTYFQAEINEPLENANVSKSTHSITQYDQSKQKGDEFFTKRMNNDKLPNKSQTIITTSTISTTSDLEIIELPNIDIEGEDNNIQADNVDEILIEEKHTGSYDHLTASIPCNNNLNSSTPITTTTTTTTTTTNSNNFSQYPSNSANIMSKSIDNEWEEVNLINAETKKLTNTTSTISTMANNLKLNKPIRNSHEFQTCWIHIQYLKRLNYMSAISEIITLLNNIQPKQLSKLIGIRMEAEMLDDLLNAIDVSMKTMNDNSLQIYDILIQLSKTERFDCALFLISDDTRQAIKSIIDQLHYRHHHHHSEFTQSQIEQIQSIYCQ
ncbi:unnamed protein product [Schistosoma turkestanicum]|nr:unnamed protein product [Schistosoma turkestanicum]